jgi:uncharacterized protein
MSVDEEHFGLKQSTIDRINRVFSDYPIIKKVLIYGSRATGCYRNGSDIDLTILGEALTHQHLNRIETQLDDLLLPYSIDLSLFQNIDNPDLIHHINCVGKIFYMLRKPNRDR